MSTPTEHEHHIVGPKIYLLILCALLVLTATTTGAAFINMGVFSPIVALGIACIKAVLVILFFMHIRYSSKVLMPVSYTHLDVYKRQGWGTRSSALGLGRW